MKNGKFINGSLILHVDVVFNDQEGMFSQDVLSGTVILDEGGDALPWIAKVTGKYEENGLVVAQIKDHKDIDSRLRGKDVSVTFINENQLTLKLDVDTGIELSFNFKSEYFRSFNIEIDYLKGHAPVLTTTRENLTNNSGVAPLVSLVKVFHDAGIEVTTTQEEVDLKPEWEERPIDNGWGIAELNDAMNAYWSDRDITESKWSLWFFMVERYSSDSMIGLMFDYSDDLQRQGAVLFSKEFEKYDQNDKEQLKLFYTIHEIGHALNLGHAWERGIHDPWSVPVTRDNRIPSFMDYHENYYDEDKEDYLWTDEFLKEFAFRFRDDALVFLRHAPEKVVKFGASQFIHSDHRALTDTFFESENISFQVLTNQEKYEYLEPVVLELRIINEGDEDVEVNENVLKDLSHMDIEVEDLERDNHYHYEPFFRGLYVQSKKKLKPKEFISHSFYLSSGRKGWMIENPGQYRISVSLLSPFLKLKSPELTIDVTESIQPKRKTDKKLISDYFQVATASMLSLSGSRRPDHPGMLVLEKIVKRFPDSRAALHANVALAIPMVQTFKAYKGSGGKSIQSFEPQSYEAYKRLYEVLVIRKPDSLLSFGPDYYGKLEKVLHEVEGRMRSNHS